MTKKKKLKQAGLRKSSSEVVSVVKAEQTVSGNPSLKGASSDVSTVKENGSSEQKTDASNISAVDVIKQSKEEPSSSFMAEQTVGQESERKIAIEVKPEEYVSGTNGSKKSRNADPKKSAVSNKKDKEGFKESKKSLLARQARERKEMLLGKMEQRLNMKKKKIKDPRLIPRMKEYLENRPNKNFVSIPQMAEYLQERYQEYGRKKKSMFVQYVDKAYTFMEKTTYNGPPPPLSDTDENSNTEKELVAENGQYVWKNVSEHSREIPDVDGEGEDGGDEVTVDNDSYSEEVEDMEELVEYKDTNAINNRLTNMYRNSPTHVSKTVADDKKRKALETPGASRMKKSKSDGKVLYPSPYVMDRNISSTGLVGPRRTPKDKYFIDRKGDDSGLKKNANETSESREVTIQKFLGNLPSRTSFGTFVSGKNDPRLKGGTLYRVYSGKRVTEQQERLAHSGITTDNVGVTNQAPKSPASVKSEDNDIMVLNDPRRKQEVDNTENVSGIGKEKELKEGKDRIARTPKKKKSSSKVKRQDDSDTESGRKETGLSVQKSNVTFADVGGNENNLIEICKLLVHMRHPEVYQKLGVTPPRGFLLHGPPGCGKTLLANAIAGELDLAMIKLAATEIVSGVSGNSEEKIRDLFDKASQSAPCVVFIDEIDAITPKRETASKDMERRIVAQLLACMDDLNANPTCHVLVIGATNRPDSLDPALRRAGRFDREICLGIPDEQSRFRILQVLCRNLRLSPEFDFNYMAHNTPGYVGADLMALTREAAMTAVNRVFQDLQSDTSGAVDDYKSGASRETESSVVSRLDASSDQTGSRSVLTETGSTTTNTVLPEKSSDVNQSNTSATQSGDNLNVSQSDKSLNIDQSDTNLTNKKMDSGIGSLDNLLQWASKPVDNSVNMSHDKEEVDVIQQSDNLTTVTEDVNKNLKNVSRPTEESITESANGVHSDRADCEMAEKIASNASEMEIDGENTDHTKETKEKTDRSFAELKSAEDRGSEYISVLSWLKEHPPLTDEQLADLYITMDDFKEALKFVQPSAKREGFATIPDVTWDDIGALHEVREELQLAILAPVRHPEQFKSLGLNRAQGVLLAGPPGCGKTLLAKAVANESGINFISVKGPELLNMYVGESERAVRTVFQRARNSAPCVIFFDELDALCPRRSGSSEGNSSARVVNQLLTEMDGLEERKQVFIMAATNRPDIIDPAVLRPGRLDKTLYVGLPTVSDRRDILNCITKNGTKPKLADDVNLNNIAEDSRCDCFTGADLAALVREASISALKEAILNQGRQSNEIIIVRGEHFDTAFRKIKPSVTPKDQERYSSMRSRLAIGT